MVYFTSLPSQAVERLAFSALKGFVPALASLPHEHNDGRSGTAGLASAPDFVIPGGLRLGVEVSEVVRNDQGTKERASAAMRFRVAAVAAEMAQQRAHSPMTVSIHFRETGLSKPRAIPLARELVSLVERFLPEAGERVRLAEAHWRALPSEITDVTIDRSQMYLRVRWHCPRAWWVSRSGATALQSSIDRKAEKLAGYLKHCEQCWLLLWVQAGTEAGAIELDQDTLQSEYDSPFARTFLWDAWGEVVHELRHRANPWSL